MLQNVDAYCKRFGIRKYPPKTHPTEIYEQPESTPIFYARWTPLFRRRSRTGLRVRVSQSLREKEVPVEKDELHNRFAQEKPGSDVHCGINNAHAHPTNRRQSGEAVQNARRDTIPEGGGGGDIVYFVSHSGDKAEEISLNDGELRSREQN